MFGITKAWFARVNDFIVDIKPACARVRLLRELTQLVSVILAKGLPARKVYFFNPNSRSVSEFVEAEMCARDGKKSGGKPTFLTLS